MLFQEKVKGSWVVIIFKKIAIQKSFFFFYHICWLLSLIPNERVVKNDPVAKSTNVFLMLKNRTQTLIRKMNLHFRNDKICYIKIVKLKMLTHV